MWCVPFAVGGITRVPTGGRVVCRFIDAFLTCCRVDGGRRRPGGRLLVRRCGTAGRPTRRTVPAPHESGLFAPRRRRKTQKEENRFRWAMRREWGGCQLQSYYTEPWIVRVIIEFWDKLCYAYSYKSTEYSEVDDYRAFPRLITAVNIS